MDQIALAGRRFGLTADTHDELVDDSEAIGNL